MKIVNGVTEHGKVSSKIVLSDIFGIKMMYPKFWDSVLSQTDFEIKH